MFLIAWEMFQRFDAEENQMQTSFRFMYHRVKLVDTGSISLILSVIVSKFCAFGYFVKAAVIKFYEVFGSRILDFLIQY